MSQVTYDGEAVTWQGQAPQDVAALLQVMNHNAAGQGRVLMSVKVDGKEALAGQLDLKTTQWQRVEVKTGTEKELFAHAVDTITQQLPDPDAAIDPILQSLLSDSWQSAFGQLNHFLQGLGGFFELMGGLAHYAERHPVGWKQPLAESLKAIDVACAKVLKLCEKQEVAELVSCLNIELRPAYQAALSLVKGPVRASL